MRFFRNTTDPLPLPLQRYELATVFLTFIAIASKVLGRIENWPRAHRFLVEPGGLLFIDLRCFQPRFLDFHHRTFFALDAAHGMQFTYPAPAALVYEFLYLLPKPVISFYLVTGAFVMTAGALFVRTLVSRGIKLGSAVAFVLAAMFCSWPLMVSYWPENIEIVIGILVGFGLYLFVTGRSWPSAILISIAAAAKLFPFAFLLLFFRKKQYKQIAFIVALAAVINVFALWAISGSISTSVAGISDGLKFLQNGYVLPFNPIATALDHSIFALIKSFIELVHHPYPSLKQMALLLRIYTGVMVVLDLTLYVKRIRFLPFLNQLLSICILAILTTPMSLDYTLMHLYVPWGMLVLLTIAASRRQIEIRGLKVALFCFLLLFTSLSEITYHSWIVGGQIKCLVLIALLMVTLRHPFDLPEQQVAHATSSSL